MDRKDVASWLQVEPSGPTPTPLSRTTARDATARPGFGRPVDRRLVAILIDWTLCQLMRVLVRRPSRAGQLEVAGGLLIFAVENVLLLSTLRSTFRRLLGLRLVSMSGGRATVQVLSRTVLLCLAIPALIWDRDQRGTTRPPRPSSSACDARVTGQGRARPRWRW